MAIPTFVTGDDIVVPVTLKKNGVVFTINPTATVKAALVGTNHENRLCDDVMQSSAAAGANWAASLVVVSLPSSSTSGITHQGDALLEIQVDDGGKRTWFVPITIVTGLVT